MAQEHAHLKSSSATPTSYPQTEGPVLIVFGNEKGGSGKSTAAMNTALGLMYRGYRVGTIDLDARQGTLTRYLRNRFLYIARTRQDLPSPIHMAIEKSTAETVSGQKQEDMGFLAMAMDELGSICDFIVIDTPGADTHLNRLAHGIGDVLITPMNDSLIDLDVLATIDPATGKAIGPSFYTKHVHALLDAKERQIGRKTDWIVMRNRLSALDNRNKREILDILSSLSQNHGFRLADGFGERLVFRDLFLMGLTAMDLSVVSQAPLTPSQQAARTEVETLLTALAPQRYKKPSPEGTRP